MTTVYCSRVGTRVFVAFEGRNEILESLLFESADSLKGFPGRAEYVFESCEQTLLPYDFRQSYDAIRFAREWNRTSWTIDDVFEFGRDYYKHLVRESSILDVAAAIYDASFIASERIAR